MLVRHGATLAEVPTAHPRHTITETPALQGVLDELRSALGGERVDFGELVALGAREKLRALREDSPQSRAARARLVEEIMSGRFAPDVAAAYEVKYLGLIRDEDMQ